MLEVTKAFVELRSDIAAAVQVSPELSIGFFNLRSVLKIGTILKRVTNTITDGTREGFILISIFSELIDSHLEKKNSMEFIIRVTNEVHNRLQVVEIKGICMDRVDLSEPGRGSCSRSCGGGYPKPAGRSRATGSGRRQGRSSRWSSREPEGMDDMPDGTKELSSTVPLF